MLAVGSIAPDFSAILDDGTSFSLSAYRGHQNVVLYFYPAAFTAGCTRQACSLREKYDLISQHDALIFGISSDAPEKHRAFRERYDLPFPMIADPDKGIMRLYDALGFGGLIHLRLTYLIDKQGVIRAAIHHDLAIGRHVTDIIEALEALEHQAVN